MFFCNFDCYLCYYYLNWALVLASSLICCSLILNAIKLMEGSWSSGKTKENCRKTIALVKYYSNKRKQLHYQKGKWVESGGKLNSK